MDYDGNVYRTVQIGNQWWMAENLKVTQYANGTAIPLVTDKTVWINLGDNNTDKAYCYYNNDPNSEYGALYTWTAATNGISNYFNPSGVQGICPTGWHIPSYIEWDELIDFLGGFGVAGGKLKETSAIHWNSPNSGTNESGFTALPSGGRHDRDGTFHSIGNAGTWWSSFSYNDKADTFEIYNDSDIVNNRNLWLSSGFSVRCVRD